MKKIDVGSDMAKNGGGALTAGARQLVVLGVALASVIPMLALVTVEVLAPGDDGTPWRTLAYTLVLLVAALGVILLVRLPRAIARVSASLNSALHEEVRAATRLPVTDNPSAIEESLRVLVEGLKTRAEAVRVEELNLQRQIAYAERVDSLGRMSVGVAHDFNNLLAVALGNTNLVLRGLDTESPLRDHARELQSALMKGIELSNQIMFYSGRVRVERKPVSLSALVEEMKPGLEQNLRRGVRLDVNLAPDLPATMADARQLRLLLERLVANATEAVMGREGRITIATGRFAEGEAPAATAALGDNIKGDACVFLRVSDNGFGIPEAVRSRIFDPFFSTKFRAQGLGLAVVLGILRGHGGAVHVDSEENAGSAFTVLLPIRPAPPAA